jgi:hypothetical protein
MLVLSNAALPYLQGPVIITQLHNFRFHKRVVTKTVVSCIKTVVEGFKTLFTTLGFTKLLLAALLKQLWQKILQH